MENLLTSISVSYTHLWDQNWKSAGEIAEIKKKLNGMGINYLLNVGPDGLGRIPSASQEILREVAKTL